MNQSLFVNIRFLVNVRAECTLLRGSALADLPVIEDAWMLVREGLVADFGTMQELPSNYTDVVEHIDLEGASILPTWCDSHTHLVFAASREAEFVDKIKGLSYAEIAAKGGGILQSAAKLSMITEEELFLTAYNRLQALIALGTGAIEIKSGYGLSVEAELKMLRVIRRLNQTVPILVKATFLGAHSFPEKFKTDREGYLRSILEEMLPVIASEGLADYMDVFCEEGFFTKDETVRLLEAGKKHGLIPKIHANQFSLSGAVQAGVELGAISVDHLETMDDDAIQTLAASGTIGTLLPGAAFFLRMTPPRARDMIRAGCALALASDFNPGSCPSGNINQMVSLACIQLQMLPEEAINAATLNGAYAMGVESEVGSITRGKRANFIVTDFIPSLAYLPYAFGSNLVRQVYINGEKQVLQKDRV